MDDTRRSTPPAPDVRDPLVAAAIDRYWTRNLRLMAVLLFVWAVAGLGCGVLFADVLNRWYLGGFPLGFWFAQQGSVVIYVLLILIYAVCLNRLDNAHRREIAALQLESLRGPAR